MKGIAGSDFKMSDSHPFPAFSDLATLFIYDDMYTVLNGQCMYSTV